jgi:hypothetical protein
VTHVKALKIKAFTGMPAKNAKFISLENQQLTFAIGFVAEAGAKRYARRRATWFLCISQGSLTHSA